jgi:ATP-dependent DNA ligase
VASAAPLPQPMLARSGTLPTRGDYAYEVKWDGFRGLLSTENGLRVRSRRGWDMTDQLPELAPEAFDDGAALWEALCERELEGIVAKRRDGRYRPGERDWVKIKNKNYWRYELERESAITKRRVKQFV